MKTIYNNQVYINKVSKNILLRLYFIITIKNYLKTENI